MFANVGNFTIQFNLVLSGGLILVAKFMKCVQIRQDCFLKVYIIIFHWNRSI